MADNLPLNTGTGPTQSRALDRGSNVYTQVAQIDIGGASGEALVSAANPMPISSAASYAEDTPHTSGAIGNLMLAIRSDNDASTADDGDYTVLKLDEQGRLKVSAKPASYADITGDITAIQATIGTPVAGGTVAGDVSRASNVMMFCTGTFSTINVTFEGSLEATGDTNWFGVQAVRSNANTIETSTGNLSAAPAYAWELSVNGLKRVRVRCTARTSGTQSWRFVLGTYATEPIPAAQVSGTQPVSGTVAVSAAGLNIPVTVADVTSAAITTTTTTAAFTPALGTAYTINIPVTAVTGTNPTLDIVVQESDDSGTNWFDVYHFPRITATGAYRSASLNLRGNRVRYVQTVGGTSPSFTRAINRLQKSTSEPINVRFIDRTIVPNTLNSVTPTYYVEGCTDFNFMARCTAQTTPATLTVQFSADGTNWHTTANTLSTVVGIAHIKVQNEQWKFARLIVSAAGSGITLGEVVTSGSK